MRSDLDVFLRRHRRADGAVPSFEDPSLPEHYPPDLELEPIHLALDLQVDIDAECVWGTVSTTVFARHAGPRVLHLDAVDFADLSLEDTEGRPVSMQYDGTKITVTWQDPFAAGEKRTAAVTYRVTSPASGLYFSSPNDHYPDQPRYVASDHETERARYWLPCLDLPNVRTTLDMRLRAGALDTILANGYLVDETDHGDGTKTAHWRLDQPCPSYLICIAIGDFVQAIDKPFDDGNRQIPLAYFCTHDHSSEDLIRTFGRTGAMLAWMTERLAMPFPYPKYYQFALPGISGAMENISLVSWTDLVIQDATLATEFKWIVDQINVHEMAHSYFGDAIVCRDFAHAWLKESWATYIERCWREDNYSLDEAQYVTFKHAQEYFEEADEEYVRPLVTRRYKSSFDLYDRHLYEGGACRLHTLRSELDNEIFWAAVQDYLARFNGKVVETGDFQAVLEEHSGRSLGRFFDQWFHTKGYPDLKVSFEYDRSAKNGTFTIEQKQVSREKSIPAFDFKVDIAWIISGTEQRQTVHIAEQRTVVAIPMAEEPEQVRFDPDHNVLHKLEFNPGDPMLKRQLVDAPDVVGRIQAAKMLADTRKRSNVLAIADAYRHEPFWGVRREYALILGELNHELALEVLVDLILLEADPMVLAPLLRAGGKYRDGRVRDALVQRIERDDLPYFARQAAYEALGNQRQNAPLEMLIAAVNTPTYNGIVQRGVLTALGASRRDEVIPLLREKVQYGAVTNRVRPAAVSALASIGAGQEKAQREQVVEQLVDLLRDPWQPVGWAAARGLRTMKAPEAIPHLTAFGDPLSIQERATVERLVSQLRSADKADGSALKKQVEDLQERIRKLEEKLQDLSARVESGAATRSAAETAASADSSSESTAA